MKTRARIALLAATCWISTAANAAYMIQANEIGGNVVFSGSGSLNLTALTPAYVIAPNASFVAPTLGIAILGTPEAIQVFSGATGPTTFGTGMFVFANATSTSGSQVRLDPTSIAAPLGYVSGSALGSSTSTFANSTFASLGLAPGQYQWSWGQGSSSDTLTLQIGEVSAVPEPATWGFMLLGFGLMGAAMRHRRRSKASANLA